MMAGPWQFGALRHPVYRRIRRVTYSDAERAAETLAARLLVCLGPRELARWRFRSIPRGGLFVLGMLSYYLDLPHEPMHETADGAPLVIVDDCSYTGARFRECLHSVTAGEIIFAHLYSPPELRRALLQAEPRVVAALAADDLSDHLAEDYPDPAARGSWLELWETGSRFPPYWRGIPETVLLPWSEPELPLRHPETGALEPGWRLAPPDRCLGSRALLGLPPREVPIRTWRAPESVAYLPLEERLLLANQDTGACLALTGPAADVWRGLAGYGSEQATLEYLVSRYEAPRARLESDLGSVRDDLEARLMLERCAR